MSSSGEEKKDGQDKSAGTGEEVKSDGDEGSPKTQTKHFSPFASRHRRRKLRGVKRKPLDKMQAVTEVTNEGTVLFTHVDGLAMTEQTSFRGTLPAASGTNGSPRSSVTPVTSTNEDTPLRRSTMKKQNSNLDSVAENAQENAQENVGSDNNLLSNGILRTSEDDILASERAE